MMAIHDDLSEMQREWRQNTTKSIDDLNEKMDKVMAAILQGPKQSDLDEQSKRIGVLERDKQRVIGAAIILNAVGAFVIWLIAKLWPNHP